MTRPQTFENAGARRAVAWLWAAVVACAAACGGGASEGAEADPASEVELGPEVADDGLDAAPSPDEAPIVFAVRRVPTSLDPLDDLDPWATRIAHDAVFEGLTRRSNEGAPWATLGLADSCVLTPADAPREAYCHIAVGRTFHDGSKVTVEDVEYSLRYWLDPRRGLLRLRHGLEELSRIELVDGPPSDATPTLGTFVDRDPGRWVRVAVERADPLLLERLASMFVVPRKAHRGSTKEFSTAPIGTGPRKVVAMEADRVVLAPVDGRGPSLVLREITDGAEAVSELRRGNVHLVAEMAAGHVPDELAKPAMAPRFEAWLLTPPRYDVIVYNVRTGPPSGPVVRGALDVSLPRAEIAELAGGTPPLPLAAPVDLTPPTPIDMAMLVRAASGPALGMAGLPEALDPAEDARGREAAAGVLDQVGWTLDRGWRRRGTTGLRLALMFNDEGGLGKQLAVAVRSAWQEIGIRVPFATASWAYLMGPLRRGDFEVALGRLAERSDADLLPYFHRDGALNVSGVADEELDAALLAFREATTPQARAEAKTRVATRLSELRPVSVLRAPTEVLVVSRRLEGLRFEDDLPVLSGLSLAPPRDWELVR